MQPALDALRDIEETLDVRVLLAVESGSRAWGFASPDSDYDVRFVYAHRRDWYLTVSDGRDVVEKMLPGDLDVSGWELRKTLRLFAKCNLALNEWIGSPIVYRSEPEFHDRLAALLPNYFNPIAGMHHYRRMAQTALDENVTPDGIAIKKLFYVLRPLLACRWILNSQSQPPTEFAKLAAADWVSADEKDWIAELLHRKKEVVEARSIPLSLERLDSLRAEVRSHEAAAALLDPRRPIDEGPLDALLRAWVR